MLQLQSWHIVREMTIDMTAQQILVFDEGNLLRSKVGYSRTAAVI